MKAEPGAEAREIHYEETSWKARPDVSPDGSRIAYSSYQGRQWQNVWVMPASGENPFAVTYGNWDDTNVRWSPSGQELAYITNKSGETAIRWRTINTIPVREGELNTRNRKYKRPHFALKYRIDVEYARVSITGPDGRSYIPESGTIYADDGYDRKERSMERHYFYSADARGGTVMVPEGRYTVEISQGFGRKPFRRELEVRGGQNNELAAELPPIGFEALLGGKWVAGDMHEHMNYGGTYRMDVAALEPIVKGEGIAVVNQLTVNKEQRFPDIGLYDGTESAMAGNSVSGKGFEFVLGQEFHTSYWGHRGILHLGNELILPGYAGYPQTAASSLFPMNADMYAMAHEKGALVGAVHPFDEVPDPFAKPAQRITDEVPVDVALGALDYMEIVGFSDHKSTAAVWYRLLNLGFRLPAGGGTDSMPNYAAPIRGQIGADRGYAWTADWPTKSEEWFAGIQNGKTFASNGPLVDFELGGQGVGGALQFDQAQAAVPFTARMRSFVPVDHVEVVCNGQVVRELALNETRDSVEASGTIPLKESGWCVLRAWSDTAHYPVMDAYEYATTSPIYITVNGKRPYRREDAEYFEAWIDLVTEATESYPDWNSPVEKLYVLGRLRDARKVYEDLK